MKRVQLTNRELYVIIDSLLEKIYTYEKGFLVNELTTAEKISYKEHKKETNEIIKKLKIILESKGSQND